MLSIERLRGSRWRGWGLAGLAAEAGRLAEAAREPEKEEEKLIAR